MEESKRESEEEKKKKDEELQHQAMMERLRLETLRKLNEEHGQKLKKFVAESRCLPEKHKSKSQIDKVSTEARRQSVAVDQVEKDLDEFNVTSTKITKLESSIANLDWELERFEIEKMKAKTERVMKRMSTCDRN